MKVSENFDLEEFLDPVTYANLERMVGIAQYIRTTTGLPVVINGLHNGHRYVHSGFRPITCTEGSKTSEHRVMNACDFKIGDWTGQQMFDWALTHAKELYERGVRRIEDPTITPTWLHLDCKDLTSKVIKVIDKTHVVQTIYIK